VQSTQTRREWTGEISGNRPPFAGRYDHHAWSADRLGRNQIVSLRPPSRHSEVRSVGLIGNLEQVSQPEKSGLLCARIF
jgi:hypothetical protein